MEPSSFLGPHQRARVAITNEVQIKTDGKKFAKRIKTIHATKGNIIKASPKLFVKRAPKKQWPHSYMDVTVVKDDLIYRENVLNLPHMKQILLSDLEVFEVRDVGKSVLVIGIADDSRETMVAYVVSERQCGEISHRRWKTHTNTLKKAEKVKPIAMRSPIKKHCVFNVYNCNSKRRDPLSGAVYDYGYKWKTSVASKS
jgi:hypothetical protein